MECYLNFTQFYCLLCFNRKSHTDLDPFSVQNYLGKQNNHVVKPLQSQSGAGLVKREDASDGLRPQEAHVQHGAAAVAAARRGAEHCGTDYQRPGPGLVSSSCDVLPN